MSMSSHPPAPTALRRFLGTSDVQEVLEEMKEEQRSLSLVQTVSVWQLLQERSVRWQTLSVAVVNVGMQLSGIDAIWFYTNTIFRNAGIPESQIPYTTVGTGAIEVVAGLIGCFTIEKLGRRPLIITGFCAMGTCLAGITGCLLLQMSTGAFSYLVFCGVCLLVALYVYLIVPETKNKTFMEISRVFAARQPLAPLCHAGMLRTHSLMMRMGTGTGPYGSLLPGPNTVEAEIAAP